MREVQQVHCRPADKREASLSGVHSYAQNRWTYTTKVSLGPLPMSSPHIYKRHTENGWVQNMPPGLFSSRKNKHIRAPEQQDVRPMRVTIVG